MKLALATCAALPALDEDGPRLQAALAARGVRSEPAVWSDSAVDWGTYDGILIRSTWDYAPRRAEFVAWATRVAACTRLLNPADVVRWNTDKRYLSALAQAGVPTVPLTVVDDRADLTLPTAGEFVIKPTISAGSLDTARFRPEDAEAAIALAGAILDSGRGVMVQPYQAGVDTAGETALLFFGGRFSHAIRKGPMLRRGADLATGLFAEEAITRRTPTPAERAIAEQVLAALPFPTPTYARVDLVPGAQGPVLLELELTEPSCFLGYCDEAADRLAASVCADLAG
ncbi:MAG: hypothetical protein R3F60_15915 [bacterium]